MIQYIPIVFCFDAKFSSYAEVSIFSVFSNADVPVKIYCIVPSSDVGTLSTIREMNERLDTDITVIGADDQKFYKWKVKDHITRASYLRLLTPDLIKENKVIYLDSDLIVQSDLSELFATSTDQCFLAGVPDPFAEHTSKMPRGQDDVYINSGVLVMNLEGLRQDRFLEKCATIYSSDPELVTYVDQCLINKYAEHRKIIIDPKWNRLIRAEHVKQEEWSEATRKDRSSIVHFIGYTKPWKSWCNPHIASFWWEYANELHTKLGRAYLHASPKANPNAPEPRLTANLSIRRNSPCPCGSGKRYKHCHGAYR